MATQWFSHRKRDERVSGYGFMGVLPAPPLRAMPRPARHAPTQCRPGWLCAGRKTGGIRLERRHLLARPASHGGRAARGVATRLLPTVPVALGQSAAAAFDAVTYALSVLSGKGTVRVSEVRRVRIGATGAVALERTAYTRRADGTVGVDLLWAVVGASGGTLRMACVSARDESDLRLQRGRVAGFLRRWTAPVVTKSSFVIPLAR